MNEVTPADMALNMSAAFFREHAGYGFNPKVETEEEGRSNSAQRLAAAEMTIQMDSDYRFEWSRDDLTNAEFEDTQNPYKLWVCVLRRGDDVVQSLSGIDFGKDGTPSKDPYRRVVEAELSLAQLIQVASEVDEAMRLNAYRSAAASVAVNKYCSGEHVQIDDDATVSESESGAWVHAWLWVSMEDAGIKGD